MAGWTRRSVLASTLACAAGPVVALEPTPPAACPGGQTKVPASRVARLARGVNLTGWIDRKPGTAPDRATLRTLRSRGFTHVRLPVRAEFFSADVAGAAASAQLSDLSRVLDTLWALDFAVSLDMHPGEEIGALRKRDPDRAFGHLGALWGRLARRFADRSPERLFFEVLNEPDDEAEYARAVRLAAAIRREAPAHTLVLGPPHWQRVEALEALTPIADPNVVYAVHFYDPMAFTHQGMDWAGPEEPLTHFRGVPFPSGPDHPAVLALRDRLVGEGRPEAARALAEQLADPWNEAQVERAFAGVGAWSRRHGAPVIVNEFGVLAWHAPPADRARWIRAVRVAAERNCLGWTHWDYADGFGLVRRTAGSERIDPLILDALVGPKA